MGLRSILLSSWRIVRRPPRNVQGRDIFESF